MKQLLQSLSDGQTEIVDVPTPNINKNGILIKTSRSLISSGTERMLLDFGNSNLIQKARSQPEKVAQVLEKISADGLLTTYEAVKAKLDAPIALGYCNVGRVIDTTVENIKIGDRVISNGPHAEIVCVGQNLCAKIPENVSDETAAFAVLASIGLQGVRLAAPNIGESYAVIGVGLIGLLTIQILKASGCNVLAVDYDENKLRLAASFGAEIHNLTGNDDPLSASKKMTKNQGLDGALITASTKSSDPVTHAAQMCRKRGKVVVVGVTGLDLKRADFYEKELTFQVSCSYGPGRYDPEYEEKGNDYPIGFVRWTEKRNFEAILEMMSQGKINVDPLISSSFDFADAASAYKKLQKETGTLGILLRYKDVDATTPVVSVSLHDNQCEPTSAVRLGCIGAGNYASRQLIPAFKRAKAELRTICSSGGTSAFVQGRKNKFREATTEVRNIFDQKEINTVCIATPHNSHGKLVVDSLRANKHVFVEKPLAITLDELREIELAYRDADNIIMVGFNRRFSPHILKMKQLIEPLNEPKQFIMTVNAGNLPIDHWHYDRQVGGGRIISECCHFIDLLRFLAGSPIRSTQIEHLGFQGTFDYLHDKITLTIKFNDGSVGTIFYLANGASSFPKEHLDIFCGGKVLKLENYRMLKGWGWKNFKRKLTFTQDKGQLACVSAFVKAIETGGCAPIPLEEMLEVSRAAIEISNCVEY